MSLSHDEPLPQQPVTRHSSSSDHIGRLPAKRERMELSTACAFLEVWHAGDVCIAAVLSLHLQLEGLRGHGMQRDEAAKNERVHLGLGWQEWRSLESQDDQTVSWPYRGLSQHCFASQRKTAEGHEGCYSYNVVKDLGAADDKASLTESRGSRKLSKQKHVICTSKMSAVQDDEGSQACGPGDEVNGFQAKWCNTGAQENDQ